jgi:hypothetical protein
MKKLDNWWNDTSMFGYRTGHMITHPWKIVQGVNREIKWAWQRVFRGWDDRVVWSIDTHISEMLPIWLKQLKEDKCGIPMMCFDDDDWDQELCKHKDGADERASQKWDNILDEMIDGFEIYRQAQKTSVSMMFGTPEYEEYKKKFDKGMNLFKEYFGCLWD